MTSSTEVSYHLRGALSGETDPGERVATLARLSEALPGLQLSFDPPDPEYPTSWRSTLRVSGPVKDFYGEATRREWERITLAIRRCVKPADAAESMLFDSRYHLVDADEHRVGQVTRRIEAGGPRDLLDFKPIHCGDGLELLGSDGRWIPGRYEMAWGKERAGVFYVHLWAGSADACFCISVDMIFRRPQRR